MVYLPKANEKNCVGGRCSKTGCNIHNLRPIMVIPTSVPRIRIERLNFLHRALIPVGLKNISLKVVPAPSTAGWLCFFFGGGSVEEDARVFPSTFHAPSWSGVLRPVMSGLLTGQSPPPPPVKLIALAPVDTHARSEEEGL